MAPFSTTATVPTPRPSRRRSIRIAVAGGALLVAGGLATLGATVLAGPDEPRPAVEVSAADAPADATTATPTASVDVEALWNTILGLDADEVAVIVPALDPQVRADLEALVAAVAGAAAR